jgi:hypothetical protein
MKDVSYLRIEAYSDHPEVKLMADQVIDSYLADKTRKNPDKYRYAARKLIASLWLRDNDMFRFGTKTKYFGNDKRKQVWMTQPVLTIFNHMRDIGLINEAIPAIPPEMAKDGVGRTTIYARSQRFKESLKSLTEADVVPDPDLPRIELKDANKFWLNIPDEVKQEPWYRITEQALQNHSDLLAKSDIRLADGSPMHPMSWIYIRKFKESFDLTGRLYAGFTTFKKDKRLGITFKGISACSLDLSQLHPTLILRISHGLDREEGLFTGLNADPYDMPEFGHLDRSIHKTLINACFNAKSLDSACRALMNAYWYWDLFDNEYDCIIYKGKKKREGEKCFPGNKAEAKRYIEAFKFRHPQLADYVCTGIGLLLQKFDSDYMLNVIKIATSMGIPVLPVHDEVVFPEDRQSDVEGILKEAFKWTFNDAGDFGQLTVKASKLGQEATVINVDLG